jgi:hypothetical protein
MFGMNRIMLTTALFFVLSAVAPGQSQPASVATAPSQREIHSLVRNAHTPAEYTQLASYFHQQETGYRSKATAEKLELDRRRMITTGPYQKYPRPVDSAQNLYDYYVASADAAAARARHFDQLAASR